MVPVAVEETETAGPVVRGGDGREGVIFNRLAEGGQKEGPLPSSDLWDLPEQVPLGLPSVGGEGK